MRLIFQWIGAVVVCYVIFIFLYDTIHMHSLFRPELTSEIQKVKTYIIEQNVAFPNIALAQVIEETNWLKSNVYKDHNNAFGMMCHKWGNECSCKDKNRSNSHGTFCDYESVESSIRDYAEWQQKRYQAYRRAKKQIPITEKEYLQFLEDVNYAPNQQYSKKVKRYILYASTVQ